MLSNLDFSPVWQIAIELPGLYFGADERPEEVSVDPSLFDNYVGRYQILDDFIVTISNEGDRLFSQTAGPKVELFAKSDTDYYAPLRDVHYSFQTDANGRATAVVFSTFLFEELAPRMD